MSNNSLGDFFLRLGVLPDKNSFETGNKLIDGLSNSMFKLMGTARNTAAVLTTTAVITGKIESQELKTASTLGISTKALDTWKAALKIAGSDANAFISSMSALDTKLAKLRIDGTLDKGLATNLGLLGLNYGEIAEMDADTRTRKIIEAARMLDDQKKASIIVGDILGSAGRDFYEYMRLTGQKLEGVLGKAETTVYTDDNTKREALGFTAEFNQLKASTESILARIGTDIGKELKDPLSKVNDWLATNGEALVTAVDDAVYTLGMLAGKIVPYLEMAAELAIKGLSSKDAKAFGNDMLTAVKAAWAVPGQVLSGNWSGVLESFSATMKPGANAAAAVIKGTEDLLNKDERIAIQKILADKHKTLGKGPFEKLDWNTDLTAAERMRIQFAGGKEKFNGYIKDGIIRPNGQVTQVAPDDWVFAARNIGDLARAFIPQGMAAAGGNNQYTISQNFTIGNTDMMPQTIRQMAYEGTRNGIEEITAQASRRLQLMPGNR